MDQNDVVLDVELAFVEDDVGLDVVLAIVEDDIFVEVVPTLVEDDATSEGAVLFPTPTQSKRKDCSGIPA